MTHTASTIDHVRPELVVEARQARGCSQSELAKILGVSRQTLAMIEAGAEPVSDAVLKKLVKELEFPESFYSRDVINEDTVVRF